MFLQPFNCCVFETNSSISKGSVVKGIALQTMYCIQSIRKMKTEFHWLQTHFAWSHHIYVRSHPCTIKCRLQNKQPYLLVNNTLTSYTWWMGGTKVQFVLETLSILVGWRKYITLIACISVNTTLPVFKVHNCWTFCQRHGSVYQHNYTNLPLEAE